MNRAEGTGLVVAVLAHVGLLAVLSAMFLHPELPPKKPVDALDVSLTEDIGLRTEAPELSSEPVAAKLSPVEAPVEPEPEPPAPAPEPVVALKPAPKPEPKPAEKAPAPVAKPKPPTTSANKSTRPPTNRDVKPTGNLDGIELGKSNNKTDSKSTKPPAAAIGPAEKASLGAELRRLLKPHWRSPSGADVDKLRTTVRAELNEDGTLKGQPRVVRQEGVTDSNRPQAELHKERAIKAVLLAAPFSTLPKQYYEGWKVITPTFDWRLSQ